MSKILDLTGQRFGRLTVIERVENKGKHTRYLCHCDCGEEKIFYNKFNTWTKYKLWLL